ncbi:MAG: MATE family efflux transporter [Fusicatenibacter saccharivorans]
MKTRMNFKDEFYQKLKLLVLPIAIQNFMLALVSATDAIMLGWIDQTSLSAVSLAGQVQFVLSLFISGIAAGAGIMAAQYWGKQDAASIEKVIPIALRTNLLFSGLFTILAGFCPEMLMRIFTNDAALVASGSQYLRAVALSYVLCGISQVYLILLKNTGHAAVSSRISSTAVVLNIILNAILIYGLCGAPALGIRGAAYATVAARVVELIWAYLETKKPERVRILWNRLFSSAGKILSEDFWRYTLPVLAASLVWGIAYVLYSVIMGHMGSDAVAANSITSIAKSLLSCLIRGVSGGAGVLIGNLLGADELEKAREYGGRLSASCHCHRHCDRRSADADLSCHRSLCSTYRYRSRVPAVHASLLRSELDGTIGQHHRSRRYLLCRRRCEIRYAGKHRRYVVLFRTAWLSSPRSG